MTPIRPNREQWWVICAAYAVVLFVQRDNLRDANTLTAFVIVGALLLAWRLSLQKAVPADVDTRRTVTAIAGVSAILAIGAFVVSNWSSPPDYPAVSSGFSSTGQSPSTTLEAPPASLVTTPQPNAPAVRPEPDPQMVWTTQTLLGQYQTNDFEMHQTYSNRFLRLVGEVHSVQGNGNEVPYIELIIPKRVEFMQAMFQKSGEQIRGLKKGDRISLSCSPVYDADVDNATLNDCSLVK